MRLVLLPGMDGTGGTFEAVLPHLRPELDPTVVDYPRDRILGYRELEVMVRAALPTTGPFWVLAQSFSGPLGARLAASPPPGLAGVVLVCTFVTSPLPGWLALLSRAAGTAPFAFRIPSWTVRQRLLGADAPAALVTEFQDLLASVKPAVLAARVVEIRGVDVRAELKASRLPLAYLQASGDRLVPARCLEVVRAARPDVRVRVLDGPHIILMRRPEAAARALRALISGDG